MSAYPVWCTDCYGCIHNTGPVKEPICAKCFKTSMDGQPSEYKRQKVWFTTTSTPGDEPWRGDTSNTGGTDETKMAWGDKAAPDPE